MDTAVRELLVPGAVVVLRTPQGEFTVTSGTTTLGATTPPRADTHFRIASNTKTMTAALILLLAQEGKLRLGDPVAKYVPGVPNGDGITIAELLKMRSGLYNFTDAPELSASLDRDPARVWTPDEVLAIAYKHAPQFPPGTAYQYNNTNYVLLGLIAEKLDGKPLAGCLRDRLFGPLDMKDTLLPSGASNTIPDPYSHGYMYGGSAFALVDKPYPPEIQAAARAGKIRPNDYTGQNPSYSSAAGGVISTANDLATWVQALVGGRVLNADYQRRWLDAVQPQDPSHARRPTVRVRNRPVAIRTEHALFPRRRAPRLQLLHRLRPRQRGDARPVDQSHRIARWPADSQCPHVEIARSGLRRVIGAAPPSPTAAPPRRGGTRRP